MALQMVEAYISSLNLIFSKLSSFKHCSYTSYVNIIHKNKHRTRGGSKTKTMKRQAHKPKRGKLVKECPSILIRCGFPLANITPHFLNKDRTMDNKVINLSNLQPMTSRSDHKGSLE